MNKWKNEFMKKSIKEWKDEIVIGWNKWINE